MATKKELSYEDKGMAHFDYIDVFEKIIQARQERQAIMKFTEERLTI